MTTTGELTMFSMLTIDEKKKHNFVTSNQGSIHLILSSFIITILFKIHNFSLLNHHLRFRNYSKFTFCLEACIALIRFHLELHDLQS